MHSSLKRLILALCLALPLLAIPQGARAQAEGATFTLQPARYDPERPETRSYFVYEVEAGRRFGDEVRVINTGSQPGVVRLYTVDATTGVNSGPVYLQADAPREEVGTWVNLEAQELTLAPGEERLVAFTVAVPPDGAAGAHLGGIVAEGSTVTSHPEDSNFAVNLQVRSVVAVQVNLPGPRVDRLLATGLTMDVENGLQVVTVGLRNEGNRLTSGMGAVTIFDQGGTQLTVIPVRFDSILPGDTVDLRLPVQGQALAAGQYRAELSVVTGEGGAPTALTAPVEVSEAQVEMIYTSQRQLPPPTAAQVAAPLAAWLPVIFAVIAAGLFALYLQRRLRRRRA